MSGRKRLPRIARRTEIIDAALRVAEQHGFKHVTGTNVSKEADCSRALIRHYFHQDTQLKRHVIQRALRQDCMRVVGQAVADEHPYALSLDAETRRQALNALLN